MTTIKNVSKEGYAWGHFGVILFHLAIASYLIYASYKTVNKRWLFIIGVVLAIVSILSLIPIFMYYNKDYKYEIDMN